MLDSFTLVRWMRLALCTVWGVVACGITIGIENMLAPPDADMTAMTAMTRGMTGGLVAGIAVHFVYNMFLLTSFVHIVAFVIILLVIKGKSRILMQQEGLASMPTPEEQQRHREMLSELHTLRHNIGYMGIHVLRPIVRFNKEDLAILK